MVLRMNKKGFFFTVLSLILVSVVIMIITPKAAKPVVTMEKAKESALKYADDFYTTLQYSILPAFVRVSSYNALYNISRNYNLLSSGDEFDSVFKELFWKETSPIPGLGNKYNMTFLLKEVESAFEDAAPTLYTLDIEKDYNKVNITIFQNKNTGPYQVGVSVLMRVTLTTPFALWNKTINVTAFVPIIGIEDPTYYNFTTGKYRNFFKYSPLDIVRNLSASYEQLTKLYTPLQIACSLRKSWNSTCFMDHVNRSAYFKNSLAPSFLQRMRLDISNHSECCGIESFLNPNSSFPNGINMSAIHYGPNYDDTDGVNKQMTYVDHCFFSGTCPDLEGDNPDRTKHIVALQCLNDTFPYFKIDLVRLDYYNLSECVQT